MRADCPEPCLGLGTLSVRIPARHLAGPGRSTVLWRGAWGRRWVGLLLGLLLPGPALAAGPAAVPDPPRVVMHAPAQEPLPDAQQLRLIFAMRQRQWSDGSTIRVFVLPDDHPLHEAFAKRRLGSYPHQLRRLWDDLVFSGTGQAPRVLPNVSVMQQRLLDTPGSIGYLPGELAAQLDARLRVLRD